MTLEEIKKDVDQLQSMAKNIKEQAALLRTAVCGLQGAVNGSVEKKLAEAEQRGYEAGLAEGRKQAEDSCEGCASAEKPMNGLWCMTCRRRYPDKYQQAGEPDDEIRVGDIVKIKETGIEIWVTGVFDDGESINGIAIYDCDYNCDAGDTYSSVKKRRLKKAGKHYPMEKLLEALRK